jgi:hypothetical protein
MITPANEQRLPKWAQDRLESYRREIGSLRKELTQLRTGTAVSEFYSENWLGGDPRNPEKFYLPQHGRLFYHDTKLPGYRLDMHASPYGMCVLAPDGPLKILPSASNSVYIVSDRR